MFYICITNIFLRMPKRQTLRDEKYEALFLYYKKILEDNKQMAGQLSRHYLCAEAAVPFFISAPEAQRIINSFTSGRRKVRSLLTQDEFDKFMEMRTLLYERRNKYSGDNSGE